MQSLGTAPIADHRRALCQEGTFAGSAGGKDLMVRLEHVTGDFTLPSYMLLQALVYAISETLRTVSIERIYVLSLRSQQANVHVHRQIAPLPHGFPFDSNSSRPLPNAPACWPSTRPRAGRWPVR